MYARSEPPHHQSRLASGRGNLATPPALDNRNGKKSNQCVNRFQNFFLSELVLHYKSPENAETAEKTVLEAAGNPIGVKFVYGIEGFFEYLSQWLEQCGR